MFGEFKGVLARKADAFGYPFQLTQFQGLWQESHSARHLEAALAAEGAARGSAEGVAETVPGRREAPPNMCLVCCK